MNTKKVIRKVASVTSIPSAKALETARPILSVQFGKVILQLKRE